MGFVIACSAALMVSQALRHGRPAETAVAVARAAGVLILGILIISIAPALRHRPSLALVLVGFAIVGATLVGATLVGATLVGATPVGATLVGTRPARDAGGGSLGISILPALAGLMDGLVLPGDYERLRQWGEMSLRNLAAFDAGALLSEALMLAAFAALAALLARVFKHRIRTEEFAPVARDIAATVFAGFGSFWLLSRLY
jgi:hypothetical protein